MRVVRESPRMRARLPICVAGAVAAAAVLASAGASAPEDVPGPNGKIALSHGCAPTTPGSPREPGWLRAARLSARRAATPRCGRLTAAGLPTARSLSRGSLRVVRADGTGDRELLLAPERLRRGRRSTSPGPDRVRDRVQVPETGSAQSASPTGRPGRSSSTDRPEEAVNVVVARRIEDRVHVPGRGSVPREPGRDEPGGVRRTAGTQALGLLRLVSGRDPPPPHRAHQGLLARRRRRRAARAGGHGWRDERRRTRARWAPDGRAVLIRRFPSVYIARLDGSAPRS